MQKMSPRERFAYNLTRTRLDAGLTQEELAGLCDVHRTEISLLERGGREPRLGVLVKLSSAIAVDLEELCSGMSWNVGSQRFKYWR